MHNRSGARPTTWPGWPGNTCIPTPAWGTNYVTADAWDAKIGQPFTQVVGLVDNTTVTMVPTGVVQGGNGVPSMNANVPTPFTVNRGEVVQFLQDVRLAGTTLQADSDKPIGVWGGSSCMNIPNDATFCDGAHQQLLPVQVQGNEYVAVRYPPRGGFDLAPYTVVGMVDGTELWYDPFPAGAPWGVDRGQLAVFFANHPFTIWSQDEDHPFYFAAHMTGSSVTLSGTGDPEFVNLVPPKQYLPFYLFATDPTYANTALVFVSKKDLEGNYQDVTLQCLGTVAGWQDIGTSNYQAAQVMIVQDGNGVGACNNGVHTSSSSVPFGLTIWGYDTDVSYAYPAGMSVEPINTIVVPPTPR